MTQNVHTLDWLSFSTEIVIGNQFAALDKLLVASLKQKKKPNGNERKWISMLSGEM